MIQRVEQYVIRKSNQNWQVCHRLCSLLRKLGNGAVYLLRHRHFEKKLVVSRKELDNAISCLISRTQGQSPDTFKKELKTFVRGWVNYFKTSAMNGSEKETDDRLRR